ncbi:MAG: hypothetical protein HY964_09465 [Ignavibacteriales bacterium]|nr:hypothetical protein [Ignavibacteriales bacterium]
MKTIGSILIILILFVGCDDRILYQENNSPLPPKGLSAFALDNNVEISWLPNGEGDINGYNVFVSTSLNGKYQFIGSVKDEIFYDRGAKNGITYYYKVSAYDLDGFESPLSRENVFATPRPEGFNVVLENYRNQPGLAGYDFSTNTVGLYNDLYTDIYFEYYNGGYYMVVWNDTEIQDMGYTASLDDIIKSPTRGWSPTKDVRLILGHTYVIQTWDYHYAKIRLISSSQDEVSFDWAYQLQAENSFLKVDRKSSRNRLIPGKGVIDREMNQ